jgi:hypothetical protein
VDIFMIIFIINAVYPTQYAAYPYEIYLLQIMCFSNKMVYAFDKLLIGYKSAEQFHYHTIHY